MKDGGDSEDNEQQEYYLEEFGKLQLNYFPDKVGIFSGMNGVTYVLMTQKSELIVFIIQAIFKQKPTMNDGGTAARIGKNTNL